MRYPAYKWTDVAINGVHNRNKIIEIAKLKIPQNAKDCYRTVYRYPDEFKQFFDNKKSVSGYSGPVYADFFPLDIDDADLTKAHEAAKRALNELLHNYTVDLDELYVYFSGSKGFHILIPDILFGYEPSKQMPAVFKLLAKKLLPDIKIDEVIYDRLRLFRLSNTKHGKSGLYKVPLTPAEVLNKTIDEIKNLAEKPRKIQLNPPEEPNEYLREAYRQVLKTVEAPKKQEQPKSGQIKPPKNAKLCYYKILEGVGEGLRDNAGLRLAVHLLKEYPEDYARSIMQAWNRRNVPPLADKDVEKLVHQATGEYDFGCNDPVLADFCDPKCVYKVRREGRVSAQKIYTLDEAKDKYLKYIQQLEQRKILLGFRKLDKHLRGIAPGEVCEVIARTGVGKCLGKGTKVLMHSGEVKKVEDVRVGDKIMGPDSKPRNVLALGRGQEQMYWVHQKYGISYKVNESHILSLKTSHKGGKCYGTKGQVLNISLTEYLKKSAKFRRLNKGYKVAVEFPRKPVPIDPYFLGLWLGDGKSEDSRIFNTDKEVIDYLQKYAVENGMRVTEKLIVGKCPSYCVTAGRSAGVSKPENTIKYKLRELNLLKNKHIPDIYLYNSKDVRVEILAGLIDSDGYYRKKQGKKLFNGPYEICTTNKKMASQIKFLCDSLGYRTAIAEKDTTIKLTGYKGKAYRVRFNGNVNEIPTLIDRKKANKWTDKADWTLSAIKIEKDVIGEYYGFTLDGDGLFLLEDMTVTHNTAFLLNVMKQVIVNQKIPVLFFSLEQPLAQIYERTIQIAAEVDGWRVEKNYTQPETAKTLHMLSKQNYSQLYIVDEDFLTYEELKEFIQIAEREKIGSRPPLVCVDYLGRMKGGGHSPYEVTSELAKQLKVLAKDLDIAILYLHQTSRMGKSGAEKISLDMARDSGVTEEAADFIIGMWRPELNNEQAQERDHEELSVAILKNRKGSIGQASFKFIKPYLKICEWEDDGSAGNVKYWDQ